ncbi:MAG: glycosyltransferase family 4 protein [Gammaproteobacteria bacterium]|nr:glycosyltransferase family 4 protein [Gammaproteobacteria bacterium]
MITPLRARCRYLLALVQGLLGTGRRRIRNGRPQVAFLVWGFPPAVWGGVYPPQSLCRYADVHKVDLSVIAGPVPNVISDAGQYLSAQLPRELALHRVDAGELARLREAARELPQIDGGFDSLLAHYTAAIRGLSRPPDLVFASGPRFESFVVAYLLARRFRAKLVLEYRDEWTECPFPFVRAGAFDLKWEWRCLRSAHHVIFTTESQRQHQLTSFRELTPDRCSVIPNGWEPADLAGQSARAAESERGARRRIAFVGYLGDHTPPDRFLAEVAGILARRSDLRREISLEFIGKKSPAALKALSEFPFPEALRLVDHLPKPEALAAMQSADALLVLNPPALARYLPGKLYDYLAMRRPLLVHGEGGEVQELVELHHAGSIIASDDTPALEAALSSISQGKLAPPQTSEQWLSAHTREALAKRTWRLLEQMLASDAKS